MKKILVQEGSRWFKKVQDGSRRFTKLQKDSKGFMKVKVGSRRFKKLSKGSKVLKIIHEGSNRCFRSVKTACLKFTQYSLRKFQKVQEGSRWFKNGPYKRLG